MNPVFNDEILKRNSGAGNISIGRTVISEESMTVKGTIRKAFLLLVVLLAAAAYTWKVFYNSTNPASITTYLIGGGIAAFVLGLIISFKPKTARILAPFYAVGEGFLLGGISASLNDAFATRDAAGNIIANSNIVTSAVLITALTTLVMLFVYRSRIIKINGTFMKALSIALISILVFYLAGILVSLFGGANSGFMNLFFGNSLLAIGINAVIAVVAAFSLLSDFHFIETASENGAEKYMEWYGAFGLMVTLVWLYLEILRLLSRIQSRN